MLRCSALHYLVFCVALCCILCCVLSSLALRYVMFFVVLCCNASCCVLCCFLLHCIVSCCVLRATSPLLQDHPRQYGCAHWAHLALCTISINLSSLSQTCIMQFCSNNNFAKNYTLSCRAHLANFAFCMISINLSIIYICI